MTKLLREDKQMLAAVSIVHLAFAAQVFILACTEFSWLKVGFVAWGGALSAYAVYGWKKWKEMG